jgi:AcrR family transcriptional regulator
MTTQDDIGSVRGRRTPTASKATVSEALGTGAESAPSEPRWHRRKEARPSELIDAALEVFVERGYAATRLEDVARRAGVTKGTMYLYFENKEALFKGMVRERVVQSLETAEQLMQDFRGSAREMLVMLMEMWWERVVVSERSGLTKLVISEVTHFPDLGRFYHAEVISRSKKMFEHALKLGMARGEFRRMDPVTIVGLVISPMLMAALWKHSFSACVAEERFEPRRFFEAHVDVLLHGLLTQGTQDTQDTRVSREVTP